MAHIQATGFYMIHQWYAVENFTALTYSDTQINLSWDIITVGMTGIVLEWSTDGVNYTELDFVGGTETSYEVTGLTANTQYWFRARGIKASTYSEYCTPDDDWTSVTLQVIARGDGSGVATLVIKVSSALELKLGGSARFYTDAAGTLGESTSTTVAATGSLVQKYIRCPSGTCDLQFMDANFLIGFGHAVGLGSTNPVWGRSTGGSYDANTPGLIATNWIFPYCVDFGIAYSAIVTFATDISVLSPALETAVLVSSVSFTGNIANIGNNCTLFYIGGANTITGDIADLTDSMQYFSIGGQNTITGDIANLPDSMIGIELLGNNTLTGDIASLDKSDSVLERIYILGQNTISGDIADLPKNEILNYIFIGGQNTITGDIANIDYSGCVITYLNLSGFNTVFGDIGSIAISITTLIIGGYNTVSGDIGGVMGIFGTFHIGGYNTISGDVSGLPESLNFILQGYNTVSGDVIDLPSSYKTTQLLLQGYNTVSGDIDDIPSVTTRITIGGYNTMTGDISGFKSGVTTINLGGYNTVYGDLNDLPSSIISLHIMGNNEIADYTPPSGGKVWMNLASTNNYIGIIPTSAGGLSESEMDDLLADLDASSTTATTLRQGGNLRGNNSAPSSEGEGYLASLLSKNITILTN